MKVEETLSKQLFWDVNPSKLNWNDNATLIIERALTRGTTADFKIVIKHYTRQQIIDAIMHNKSFDRKTAHFASRYFNVPINKIHVAPEYY